MECVRVVVGAANPSSCMECVRVVVGASNPSQRTSLTAPFSVYRTSFRRHYPRRYYRRHYHGRYYPRNGAARPSYG